MEKFEKSELHLLLKRSNRSQAASQGGTREGSCHCNDVSAMREAHVSGGHQENKTSECQIHSLLKCCIITTPFRLLLSEHVELYEKLFKGHTYSSNLPYNH